MMLTILIAAAAASSTPATNSDAGVPSTHAWGDVDRDGLPDLYIAGPGIDDRLLKNRGDGSFEDVTAAVGLAGSRSRAISWRDFDADGRIDLLQLGVDGRARLFQNLAASGLVDVTVDAGLGGIEGASVAEWLDYDQDGLPDLRFDSGVQLALLHNQGDGSFAAIDLGLPTGESERIVAAVDRAHAKESSETTPAQGPGASGETSGRRAAAPGSGPSESGGSNSSIVIGGSGIGIGSASGPPAAAGTPSPTCFDTIRDQAGGACLDASSVPVLGSLYPMSPELNVDPSGRVGIGTIAPNARVEIDALGSDTGLFAQRGSGGGAAPVINAVSDAPDNFSSAIKSEINATSGISYSLWARNLSANGFGLFADARHASGPGVGVVGRSLSPAGVGIEGQNPAAGGTAINGYASGPSGVTTGVRGRVASPDGVAIHGEAQATTGMPEGVRGETSAPNGYGVRGVNDATQPLFGAGVRGEGRIGVFGEASSAVGIGIVGKSGGSFGGGVSGAHELPPFLTFALYSGSGVSGSSFSPAGIGVAGANHSSSGLAIGVHGLTFSTQGTGVAGTGGEFGVHGRTAQELGTGVFGEFTGTGLLGFGVRGVGPTSGVIGSGDPGGTYFAALETGVSGSTNSTIGAGVAGFNVSTIGESAGVFGRTSATRGYGVIGESPGGPSLIGAGVLGRATGTNPGGIGVIGQSSSTNGIGTLGSWADSFWVYVNSGVSGAAGAGGIGVGGVASAASGGTFGIGVAGNSYFDMGAGVQGTSETTNGVTRGVRGVAMSSSAVGVEAQQLNSFGTALLVLGDSAVTGFKSFAHPHPDDATKEIRFFCLEGNESGTYFRGSAQLLGGIAVIEVPEDFRAVTEIDGLTVQLTPNGPGELWIARKDLNEIVVQGVPDVTFDFLVNGVRHGCVDAQTVRHNVSFRPIERGVPYGAWLPAAARQRLVDNGTLNPDFTPNEVGAAARGWALLEPEEAHPRPASSDRQPRPQRQIQGFVPETREHSDPRSRVRTQRK